MTKAAGVVGFWTAMSRVLGFVRDMVIASFLGAGLGADAFFVAFRIPNLLRRLFAEGALSAAFVPTFVDTFQRVGHEEAARLARITFTFAALVLAVVTVACMLGSSWLVRITAPGFIHDAIKFHLTVDLTRLMFPYIFFISLVALASGVLNSLRYFGAPAAAPVILNVCMIGSVFACRLWLGVEPYWALASGVVAGGIFQLVLQLPFLRAAGIKLKPVSISASCIAQDREVVRPGRACRGRVPGQRAHRNDIGLHAAARCRIVALLRGSRRGVASWRFRHSSWYCGIALHVPPGQQRRHGRPEPFRVVFAPPHCVLYHPRLGGTDSAPHTHHCHTLSARPFHVGGHPGDCVRLALVYRGFMGFFGA